MQDMEFLEFGWDYDERLLFVVMRTTPSILVDLSYKVEVHFFSVMNRLQWTSYSNPISLITYDD